MVLSAQLLKNTLLACLSWELQRGCGDLGFEKGCYLTPPSHNLSKDCLILCDLMSSDLGSAAVLGPPAPSMGAKAWRLVTLRTWFVVLTSCLHDEVSMEHSHLQSFVFLMKREWDMACEHPDFPSQQERREFGNNVVIKSYGIGFFYWKIEVFPWELLRVEFSWICQVSSL